MDCSRFLNWSDEKQEPIGETAVIFRSLVATIQLQPVLDDSLEAKAVRFLKSVDLDHEQSTDDFLYNFASISDHSSTNFVQSIVVLISTASHVIKTAAMTILGGLIRSCSAKVRLSLVKADLIHQLVVTLNPQSLSFAETVDIHTWFVTIILRFLWLTTPRGLSQIPIEDGYKQQAVHETTFKQVLITSEKYIWHLCMNRFSINDGAQSERFLNLISQLIRISPYYQPTMDFILPIPVVLTIPSCLTFFENVLSIWFFLIEIVDAQREWNKQSVEVRKNGKTLHRMLRMEGMEDAMEEKLKNDKKSFNAEQIVAFSIEWNNQQGMNLPRRG